MIKLVSLRCTCQVSLKTPLQLLYFTANDAGFPLHTHTVGLGKSMDWPWYGGMMTDLVRGTAGAVLFVNCGMDGFICDRRILGGAKE